MTLNRTNCQHLDSILSEIRSLKASPYTQYDSFGFQVSLITLLSRLTFIELSSIPNTHSINSLVNSSEIQELLRSLLLLESLIGQRVRISSKSLNGKMAYGVSLVQVGTDGDRTINCSAINFEQLDLFPGMP
jgi:hypothetical protein